MCVSVCVYVCVCVCMCVMYKHYVSIKAQKELLFLSLIVTIHSAVWALPAPTSYDQWLCHWSNPLQRTCRRVTRT